jgi:choline dehydrogenase-like flavoprotein
MKDYSDHICVIGAGIIGNHISGELLSRGHKVLVVEAGGFDFESELLGYNDYHFATPSMLPANVHRVGGGGNYWIGRIGEFLNKDFVPLKGIRKNGWLFDKHELLPFYRAVYLKLIDNDLLDTEFVTKFFTGFLEVPFGLGVRPIRYTEPNRLRDMFIASLENSNLTLLKNTLVTEILRRNNGMEIFISTKKEGGSQEEFKVAQVVIAGGTLQSAKLFLDSPQIQNLENTFSAGSFLMEHLDGFIGTIDVSNSNRSFIRDISLDSDRKIKSKRELDCGLSITLGSLWSEDDDSINVSFDIVNQVVYYKFAPERFSKKSQTKISSYKVLYFFERITRKLIGTFKSVLKEKIFGVSTYSIWLKSEELPYRESQVISDVESKKLIYSHMISDETSAAVRAALIKFQSLVASENLGVVKYYDDVINASKKLELRPNWHPMGTLRMGEPGNSVVDRNLMLHGVEGVYVLSSAVFPTGSNQNPVFTTLALGSRLADHITRKS